MIWVSHALIVWPLLTGNLTSLQRTSDTKKLEHAIRIHRFRHSSAHITRNAMLCCAHTMVGPYCAKRLPFHYNLLMNVPRCIAHTVPISIRSHHNSASIFLAIRTIGDTNNKIRIWLESAQWYIELNNVYRTKRHIGTPSKPLRRGILIGEHLWFALYAYKPVLK